MNNILAKKGLQNVKFCSPFFFRQARESMEKEMRLFALLELVRRMKEAIKVKDSKEALHILMYTQKTQKASIIGI